MEKVPHGGEKFRMIKEVWTAEKSPAWWKKSGRRSPPVYRGRGPLRGEGVRVIIRMVTTHYSLLTTH